MYCRYCGTQINNSAAKFCPGCGNPIPTAIPTPRPVASATATQAPQQPTKQPKPQKRTKKKKGKITALVLCVVFLLSGIAAIVCFVDPFGFFKAEISLTELTVDNAYLVAGIDQEVLFTVKADVATENICLYKGKRLIATMEDNGQNGDVKAGDNIYSYTATLNETIDSTSSVDYHCSCEDAKSNYVTLYFFTPLENEKELEQVKKTVSDLSEQVQDIEKRYADASDYVPVEKQDALLNEIADALDEAVEKNIVLTYQREENSLLVKLWSGLSLAYSPPMEGVDAVGNDVSMSIYSLQPMFTQMGGTSFGVNFTGYELPENVNSIMEMQDAAAQSIKDMLPNYRFPNSNNCNDEDVTLEKFRSIGSNQIVLLHTHGYYGPVVKSCLCTGEPFDWDAYLWDINYYADCVSNAIINSWMTGYDTAIISSLYIKKYCGKMTNTFVYLAACDSGRHSGLANAFTDKGAVVIANSATIQRTYNVAMLYGTVTEMLKINPDNGKFYTAKQALERAKQTYGQNDSDPRYGGKYGATPLLFDTSATKDYRFADDVPTGQISGKVCKASDRKTAIPEATVDVLLDGNSFRKVITDSNGNYALDLPLGKYEIQISANGYISFRSSHTIQAGSTTYLETFLMVSGDPSQTGTASGKVINSLSGQGASNVKLSFKKDWNNTDLGEGVLKTTYTDSDGDYTISLPFGNYTVIAEKDGYTTSSFNIVSQKDETKNQDGTITPEISGSDYLITLTWDENPEDVDSHMVGKHPNGNEFHVFYRHKNEEHDGETVCNLDYDDTTSYGPEHITLSTKTTEPYYYYLHRFSGSGTLASSGAKVTIEQGNVILAEFHVPTNIGGDDYWNIFAIKDGEIIVSNTITASPDTSYADD